MEKRKSNRLKDYDYSSNGSYFITICTKDHAKILSQIVGANCVRPKLSKIGEVVENEITKLSNIYDNVSVNCYVIMPNHIHMIILIQKEGRTQFAPTISRIIKQFKGTITKQAGFSPWQKSFHDHIIRNEKNFITISEYIKNNPINWKNDCFYNSNNSN
ncbi:MAG: hypothetical protein FWD82_06110 [Defluviitaleaceae bacterium]|nr:hypothetical protein [Defluviitaleaceae bacterium]